MGAGAAYCCIVLGRRLCKHVPATEASCHVPFVRKLIDACSRKVWWNALVEGGLLVRGLRKAVQQGNAGMCEVLLVCAKDAWSVTEQDIAQCEQAHGHMCVCMIYAAKATVAMLLYETGKAHFVPKD